MVFSIVWTNIIHMPKTLKYLFIFFSGFSTKTIFKVFILGTAPNDLRWNFAWVIASTFPLQTDHFNFSMVSFRGKVGGSGSQVFTNDKIISFITKSPLITEIQENIIFCYILYRCVGACSCNLKKKF